jgi:hypothetical protein
MMPQARTTGGEPPPSELRSAHRLTSLVAGWFSAPAQRHLATLDPVDLHAWPGRLGGGTLTNGGVSRIKEEAAVAATRGDLGQLAPRKKLLKSCRVSQKNF